MKYLKKFNESVSTRKEILKELLSKPGWKQVEPEHDHWNYQLEYNLTDKVKIKLINFEDKEDFNYYLVSDDKFNYVSAYKNNHTQLYSEYNSIYLDLSDYDRMIKICNYLLPYYEKKPDNDTIEDIRECFIGIEDMLDVFDVRWGYVHSGDEGHPFFPAYRFSDKLGLFFIYEKIELNDEIREMFEEDKKKLEYFDIHPTRASLFEMQWGGFMIGITF